MYSKRILWYLSTGTRVYKGIYQNKCSYICYKSPDTWIKCCYKSPNNITKNAVTDPQST